MIGQRLGHSGSVWQSDQTRRWIQPFPECAVWWESQTLWSPSLVPFGYMKFSIFKAGLSSLNSADRLLVDLKESKLEWRSLSEPEPLWIQWSQFWMRLNHWMRLSKYGWIRGTLNAAEGDWVNLSEFECDWKDSNEFEWFWIFLNETGCNLMNLS